MACFSAGVALFIVSGELSALLMAVAARLVLFCCTWRTARFAPVGADR